MNVIYGLFANFLDGTLAASLVILVVIALQVLLQKVIRARVRYLLWLLVIIRLLLPVIPDSPVSMFHVLHYGEEFKITLMGQDVDNRLLANPEVVIPSEVERNSDFSPSNIGQNPNSLTGSIQQANGPAVIPSKSAATRMYAPWMKAAALIWIGGVLLFLMNGFGFMRKWHLGRKQLRRVTDIRITTVLEDAMNRFGVKRNIPLYTGSTARSPYLSGVLRPWIYIPETALQELTSSQLLHILAHELAHYKRWDTLWNLLGNIAAAIHWLNPILWLGLHKMKVDRELACDAYVLEVLGEEEATAYGLTLLEFVKRFSMGRRDRELLHFFGSQPNQQIVRRITMIRSFQKGSYRVSAAAVLLIALLSAMTLTNASGEEKKNSTLETTINQIVNDDIIHTHHSRNYNRLDRALDEAGFVFQAPTVLHNFSFDRAYLSESNPTTALSVADIGVIDKVSLYFIRYEGDSQTGQFSISAFNGGNIEDLYANIEQSELSGDDKNRSIDRRFITIGGVNSLLVNVNVNPYVNQLFYLWEREGVVYELNLGSALLSQEEIASLIASMSTPDEQMKSRFANEKMLNVDVIDMQDIRLAVNALGFVPKFPKFPMKEPDFSLYKATITQSMTFSYPQDMTGEEGRMFQLGYYNSDAEKSETQRQFSFLQMQNKSLYETFKADGQVFFWRIDGEKFGVALTSSSVNGHEVLVTEPYKIDGELSSANETDFLSYFWQDHGVIYKVGFTGVPPLERQLRIVSSLIEAPVAEIDELGEHVVRFGQ